MRDAYKNQNRFQFHLSGILIGLAVMYNNLGKNDLAVKYMEEAVSLIPEELECSENDVTIVLELADSYRRSGQPTKAKNTANRAFKSSFVQSKELFKMIYPIAAAFF